MAAGRKLSTTETCAIIIGTEILWIFGDSALILSVITHKDKKMNLVYIQPVQEHRSILIWHQVPVPKLVHVGQPNLIEGNCLLVLSHDKTMFSTESLVLR
jgi:hypothetical protein